MSQQIQITGGAKVRDLQDVIIGSSGVLSSLAFDVANGVPKLDSNGKILVSQLPNSVMEYKGTWNAATNTPTLANGTGNQGDVYLCNVAGTTNFGAGPIAFIVGDSAVYSGSIWQRSGGATGSVTSVGLSTNGGAITIGSSPVTTSGTITANFNGTNLQYVNGAGNLTTFPTLITSIGLSMPSAFSVANSPLTANGTIAVTGAGTTAQYIRGDGSLATFPTIATEAQRLITEVYNETGATLTKGTVVYINGGHGNLPTITKAIATGDATSAQTYGIVQTDITNNNNGYVVVIGSLTDLDTQAYANGTQLYLSSTVAGQWTSVKQYAPAHLVYVAIVTRSHPTQGVVEVRIQNGFEMDELHNVSAQSPLNNQGLFYNTSTSLWENKSIATALGYTPANDALVVHNTGNETIGGTKTFTDATKNNGGIFLQNASSSSLAGYMNLGGLTNGVKFTSGGGVSNSFTLPPAPGYTFTFPNATGTIALTSDIPSLTGYVPYTGATTNVDLGGNSLYFNNGQAVFGRNLAGTTAYALIGVNPSNKVQIDISALGVVFGGTIGNGTYTYTLPSATGTIALLSNISYPVTSVFGRTGAVVATEGDYSLTQLSDVTITSPTTNQVLKYNGTAWVNDTDANTGTVTSVGLSAPTGFSVTGSPVTTSGTLALAFASGYSLPTTVKQSNWDDAYTFVAAFPTQTGNSGKYLTTDGSVLSWATNPLGTVTSVGLSSATSGVTIGSSPVTTSGTITLAIATASGSQNGLLSSTDWTTFNSKQAELNGTGFVKASGTTISYDNSTYLTTSAAASTYLPLTGGTLTGALNGTSAVFNSSVTAKTFSTSIVINPPSSGVSTGVSIGFDSNLEWGWIQSSRNSSSSGEIRNLYIQPLGGVTAFGPSQTITFSAAGAGSFTSSITASSLIKSGGTSAQILAADGSVITAGTNITISGGTISSTGGGGGSITLSAIGSTPNANAATLTGSVLNLEPASASFGGVVTTGTQTFAGQKTFSPSVTATSLIANGSIFSPTLIAAANSDVLSAVYINPTFTNGAFTGLYNYALNANGRVLINYSKELRDDLTNPALSVANSSSNPALVLTNSTNGVGQSVGIYFGQMTTSTGIQARGGGSIRSIATGTYTAGNGATYVSDLAFYTGNSGDNQKLILIGSTGYLGVNTATVGSQLQVNGNAAIGYSASTAAPTNGLAVSGPVGIGLSTVAANVSLQIKGGNEAIRLDTTSAALDASIRFYNNNSATYFGGIQAGPGAISGGGMNIYGVGAYPMIFSVNSGERIRINTSGNVGIATTTIGSTLQVNGNAAIGYSASTAAPTNGLAVAGQSSFGTNAFTTTYNASFGTILLQSYGVNNAWFGDNVYYNGTNFVRLAAGYAGMFYFQGSEGQFRFGTTGAAGGSIGTGTVTLKTALDGTFAVGNLSTTSGVYTGSTFLVNSSGSVGIGTITIGSKLQVNGNAAIGYSASTAAPSNGLAVSGSLNINNTTNTTYKLSVYNTVQDTHLLVAGTAPSLRFADTITSITYSSLFGMATQANNFITGSAAGDFAITWNSANKCYFGYTTATALMVIDGGNLGLGTLTIGSKAQINGNMAVGYSASTAAPTNGILSNGGFKSSAPAGATASTWKLGNISNTTVTHDRVLYVEIDGTTYSILASTTI